MSEINTSENVGGAPLPPTRNKTKPTVIRPASKAPDSPHPQQAPPRPAPPVARPAPPPPATLKQNNESKISKPESQDQRPLSHKSSINGPTLSAKPGSVKKKLEITIVDARPMSEAGFRGMKGDATSPTVLSPLQTGNISEKNEFKPEITRKVDQDGPLKPNRSSLSRPATNEGEIITAPAKPSKPAVVASIQVEVTEPSLNSTDNPMPPKPMRPTIIRPQSHFQKPTDQKLSETAVNPQQSQQPSTLPPTRPKLPEVLPTTVETAKLSPTPRPRSSVITPPEETKTVPVPSPRPVQRNAKTLPAKPESSVHQTGPGVSQRNDALPIDNGLVEPKSSPLEPPQRPKRPSAQPKPNLNSKQADEFTDVGPVYAKIVKPSSNTRNHDSSVEDFRESKPEPGAQFQVKLRSTTSEEDSPPGGVKHVNPRASQAFAVPKPTPKPKPLSRSQSGKTTSPTSELPSENVSKECPGNVQIRPKSNEPINTTSSDEVKPGHISGHFLAKFEQKSDDQPPGPPLPSRRPVTVIGGPHRNQASKPSTVATEEKIIETAVEKPKSPDLPKKSSTEFTRNHHEATAEVVDVKKPPRPTGPPHPDGGTHHPASSSQPCPSVDLNAKPQPSLSDDKKQQVKVTSNLPNKEKPGRPASTALPKPSRPSLPIRPKPGHPLYHYMSKEPHGIAVHDYTARHEDELSFKVGDTVLLLRQEDQHWYLGKVGSKEGLFPANYINVKCSLPDKNVKADNVNAEVIDAVDSKSDVVKGPRCKARFDFEGEGDNDLALEDGDVVQIIERVGTEWLRGEHRGRRGMFPVSFVEIIEDLPSSKDPANVQVTAIADFTGQEGELSFSAGDTINVLSQVNNEWLQGEFQGKKGRFPAAFVSHIPINLPEYKPYKKPQGKAAGTAPSQGKQLDVGDQTSSAQPLEADVLIDEGPALLQLSKETVLGYCRGRFDYLDPPLGDLAFKAGDRIEILEFYGEDWARGRLGKKEGMIPLNLVAEEIIEPDIIREPEVKEIVYGKVVHDFQGENEQDLTIKEGDVVEMEEIADTKGNWRWGRLNGKRGMFPVLFVEVISNQK